MPQWFRLSFRRRMTIFPATLALPTNLWALVEDFCRRFEGDHTLFLGIQGVAWVMCGLGVCRGIAPAGLDIPWNGVRPL
jgi:hypothetical protein